MMMSKTWPKGRVRNHSNLRFPLNVALLLDFSFSWVNHTNYRLSFNVILNIKVIKYCY